MTEKYNPDYHGMYSAQLDALGSEVIDPYPLVEDIGIKPVETMDQRIRRLIHSERLAMAAEKQGFDTEEEADDFEIDDDDELIPMSSYEAAFLASDETYKEEEPIAVQDSETPPVESSGEKTVSEPVKVNEK